MTIILTEWRRRIDEAKANGFTEEDEADAMNWVSCAVGERHLKEFHRELAVVSGRELTDEADELGMNFGRAVDKNQVELAFEILQEIEDLEKILA